MVEEVKGYDTYGGIMSDTPMLDQLAAAAAAGEPQEPMLPSLPLQTPPMFPEPNNAVVDIVKLTAPTGETHYCVTITQPNCIARFIADADYMNQLGRLFIENATGLVMPGG